MTTQSQKPQPKYQRSSSDTKVLITGVMHGGVQEMYNFLSKNEENFLMDDIGKKGTVSWVYGANLPSYVFDTNNMISWRESGEQFGPVVHILRHPLSVISSIIENGFCTKQEECDKLLEFFTSVTNVKLKKNMILAAARYWLEWNVVIEDSYHDRYQIHAESTNMFELLSYIGAKNETALPSETLPNTIVPSNKVI